MSLYTNIAKGIPAIVKIPPELEPVVNWYENSDKLIGGLFEFYADEELDAIENWFGKKTLPERFGVFGIMPDGSLVAFWINEQQEQKIIMLGSEGECQLILANNFLDFIRLVAIGYHEFTYTDFDLTIEEHNQQNDEEPTYGVNLQFQKWLKDQFNVTIPQRGNEIINHADNSFSNWVNKQLNA